MGSSASVWLLNVAIFLGAEYLGDALGGHWRKPTLPGSGANGCTWKDLSYVPAEVPERVAN